MNDELRERIAAALVKIEAWTRDVKGLTRPGVTRTLALVHDTARAALAQRAPERSEVAAGLDVERMARAAEKVGLRMAVEWWREVAAEYARLAAAEQVASPDTAPEAEQ